MTDEKARVRNDGAIFTAIAAAFLGTILAGCQGSNAPALTGGLVTSPNASDQQSKHALPSGTLTFLFSDIEASTARWEFNRAAIQEAVRRHDALIAARRPRT